MTALTATAALDRHFLEARGKLLEVAAILDRIDRGADRSKVENDNRLRTISEAIRALDSGKLNRAEKLQTIFSLPYEDADAKIATASQRS